MVEKGMDWKKAVIPTESATPAAPSPTKSTAPADAKPSSGQYVLIF